ncbi:helix-turn-helix transcriptional regulator [Streptomyces sp. NPDC052069]|uniref:helix-turn-helix transcriptional regulator n=1 Tax=Streptomyces sp. NPDC052069 TaxID=3154650 RepID=UPI0034446B94
MERTNPHRNDGDRATPEEFAAWLRDQLERRGYDLRPRGGGQTRFAADSGIGQASVSRMLRGQGAPETRVLETLAVTLELPLAEVLVAAGILTRDVLQAIRQQTPRTDPLTPEAAAEELGITDPQGIELFVSFTETLRKQRAKNGEDRIAEN